MSEHNTDPVGAPTPVVDSGGGQAPPQTPPSPAGTPRADSSQGYAYGTPSNQAAPGPGPGWQDPRRSAFESRRKSPGLASLLSLAPGLGQVYLGYYMRGFTHLAVVAFTISLLAEGDIPNFMYPLLGLFLPFFWLYNIVDAGRRAAYYNMVMEGGSQTVQPEFDMPQRGGSIAGGLALIIGGLFLLLHIQLDLSLRWLETWWPIIPVFIGIYLFTKGLRERSESA